MGWGRGKEEDGRRRGEKEKRERKVRKEGTTEEERRWDEDSLLELPLSLPSLHYTDVQCCFEWI